MPPPRTAGEAGSRPRASRCPTGRGMPRTTASTRPTPPEPGRSTPGTAPPTPTAGSPTARRAHAGGAASTDGTAIWWFDDTDGDEFGVWVREPFDGGSGAEPAVVGRRARLPGRARPGPAHGRRRLVDRRRLDARGERGRRRQARVLYTHTEDAGIGALSRDETLLAISHAEHGDSRHPAVRVLRVADGVAVGERLRRRGARASTRSSSRPSRATSGCSSATSAGAATSC